MEAILIITSLSDLTQSFLSRSKSNFQHTAALDNIPELKQPWRIIGKTGRLTCIACPADLAAGFTDG